MSLRAAHHGRTLLLYGRSHVESHVDLAAECICSHILIKVIGSNRDRKVDRIRGCASPLHERKLKPEMNTSSGLSAYSNCQLADNLTQSQNIL